MLTHWSYVFLALSHWNNYVWLWCGLNAPFKPLIIWSESATDCVNSTPDLGHYSRTSLIYHPSWQTLSLNINCPTIQYTDIYFEERFWWNIPSYYHSSTTWENYHLNIMIFLYRFWKSSIIDFWLNNKTDNKSYIISSLETWLWFETLFSNTSLWLVSALFPLKINQNISVSILLILSQHWCR